MKIFFAIIVSAFYFQSFPGLKAAENPEAAGKTRLDSLFPDKPIAKGNNFEIKRSQLDAVVDAFRANAASTGQRISPEKMGVVEARLLERLIITEILVRRATAQDKTKGKEVADKYLAEFRNKVSPGDFVNQWKALGMTPEQLQNRILEQAICEEILDREVKAQIQITEEEVKKFYDQNPAQFQEPEKVRVTHLLIGTRNRETGQELPETKKLEKKELALKILARARSGEDFSQLVADHSEAAGAKRDQGEVTFSRDERQVPAEFRYAAFSMKTNQISDLVTTPHGFHIIKFQERIPTRKIEFAKAAPDIKEVLLQQEVQKRLPAYFEQQRKEAGVVILDEKLKLKENGGEPLFSPTKPAVP